MFKVTQGKSIFTQGEQVYINDQPTDLNVSTVLPDYIKTSGKFQVKSGDTIRGVQSGSAGVISKIYVNRGPGSFAGIRNSLSVVKAIHLVNKTDYYCFSFEDFKGESDKN